MKKKVLKLSRMSLPLMVLSDKVNQVRSFLERGEVEEAKKILCGIKASDTSNLDYNYWIKFLEIEMLLCQGYSKKAHSLSAYLREDVDIRGRLADKIRVQIQYGEILWQMGHYPPALDALENTQVQIDQLTPSDTSDEEKDRFNSKIIYLKLFITFYQGDVFKGLALANKVIERQRKRKDAYQLGKLLQIRFRLYWNNGRSEDAEKDMLEAFNIFYKDKNYRELGKVLSDSGLLFMERGDLNTAIIYLNSSINLLSQSSDTKNLGISYLYLTKIYQNKGELNQAFSYGQTCYKLFLRIENDHFLGEIMYYLGLILKLWGDQEAALNFLSRSVKYHNNVGRIGGKALSYIAEIYHHKRDFDNALKYYTQCLEYFEEIGYNLLEKKMIHFNLVKLYHEKGNNKENLNYHLKQLEEIEEKEKTPFTHQIVLLSRALQLKSTKRLSNMSEAQQVYTEIANEDICFYDFTIEAIINLCDILVYELKISGLKEILSELTTWINKLREIAEHQPSYSLLVEVLLLQSKVAISKLEFELSDRLLTRAEEITNQRNLKTVLNRVKIARSKFKDQVKFLKKIKDEYEIPPIEEILLITGLTDDLNQMLQIRKYPEVSSILTYADKVRALYG